MPSYFSHEGVIDLCRIQNSKKVVLKVNRQIFMWIESEYVVGKYYVVSE